MVSLECFIMTAKAILNDYILAIWRTFIVLKGLCTSGSAIVRPVA